MNNGVPPGKDVVIFDGNCNFCTGWVLWVIRHDKKDRYRFAANQLETGRSLINKYGEKIDESVLLIRNNVMFEKSDAALRIFAGLGGVYSLTKILFVFPMMIRNLVYDFIAKRRYRWWGRKDQCYVPDEKIRSKFLS